MTLTDEAARFIEAGSFRDEEALLLKCVSARTLDALRAVQMMYEDMYGGLTFNYEHKAPAAFALIAWGAPGLEALVEGGRRTSTSKNNSLVLDILAHVASSEGAPPSFAGFFVGTALRDAVFASVSDWRPLAGRARHLLREFVLAFADDEDAYMAVGLQFMKGAMLAAPATREIFAALAGRLVSVSASVIQQFRSLISSHSTDEPRFQSYFEQHPQLLDPMAREVWPQPNLFGVKEPDFILRRADNTYVVVEIETPAKRAITGSGQLSADATHAVSQAIDYVDYLVQHIAEAQKKFPGLRNPEALVIVGVESTLSVEQQRRLLLENHARPGVRIVGFDWVGDRAEAISHNIVSHRPSVSRVRLGSTA